MKGRSHVAIDLPPGSLCGRLSVHIRTWKWDMQVVFRGGGAGGEAGRSRRADRGGRALATGHAREPGGVAERRPGGA